jgi:hypothetical protein
MQHNFKDNPDFPFYNQHDIKSDIDRIEKDLEDIEKSIDEYYLVGNEVKEREALEESIIMTCLKYDFSELLMAALN